MSDAAAGAAPAVTATADNFSAHLSAVDASGTMDAPSDGGGLPPNDFGSGTSRGGAQSLKQALRDQAGHHIEAQPSAEGEPHQELPEAEIEVEAPPQQEGDVPPYESLQEMYRALEAPDLHEGLWDKTIPTPVNGVTVPKSIRELRDGYMRMSDYSRGKQETAQAMRQAQQAIHETRSTLQRLNDPAVLRATLRRMGPQYEQSFYQAASQFAQEYATLQRASPAERAAILRSMDAERRAELAEEMARRAPQEQQKAPHEQYVPHIHQTLEAVLPQTWQRHGLQPSPIAMQVFAQNIQYVWDGRMESIPQAVERATVATIEILGDQAAQHRQFAQPQRQPQQALAPRRLPAPAPQPQRGPQRRNEDYRSTKFGQFLKSMGK